MKENFLHFVSETPSTLTINGKYIGAIDNITSMELDIITKANNIFVSYSPVSLDIQALPYTFCLNTFDKPRSENKYIKVIPFPNNNYDIIMKPFYYYQITNSNVLFNKTVGKYFVSIISDNVCKITIYSGGSIVFNISIPSLVNVDVEEKKGLLIIKGILDENNYYLLIIDTTNFEILHNDTVQSIEVSSEYITSYKKENTICKHARVFSLDMQSKFTEKYYVYDKESYNEINEYLIPYALLECINVGDEKMTKSFLGNNLVSSNIQQLKNYFGDIKNIYFNRHNTNHKLNYTIESNTFKNYNFIIEQNKIIDIEENF